MVDPKSIHPGQVLAGKYRVDRVLGVGGMGVVLAATHMHLGQRVAIKMMLPEILARPTLAERFGREARAAASLTSAHVARVFDVGVLDEGLPYMVMEFLEGSDLASTITTRGPLPVDVAVDYVLQACDAVAEAHARGIVHRDLKPGNLFLCKRNDGRALVKVLDFGISKQTATPAELSITHTTEVIGSPNYMSPEQFRSARLVDARTDIWSLGVILHELLTGTVPFVAETFSELTLKVLQGPPAPLSTRAGPATPDLARIVARCLEKDPARRFPDVAELAAALARFAPPDTRELAQRIARIAQPGVQTAPSAQVSVLASGTAVTVGEGSSSSRRKGWIVGIVLALGAVAAIGGVVARRARDHGGQGTAASAPPTSAGLDVSATATAALPTVATAPTAAPPAMSATASAPAAPTTSTPAHALTAAAALPPGPVPTGRTHVHAGPPPAASPPAATPQSAASASSPAEPPSHRTSW